MNHSSKHTEIKYLNNIWKNKIKAKSSLLKLDQDIKMGDNIIQDARYLFALKKNK